MNRMGRIFDVVAFIATPYSMRGFAISSLKTPPATLHWLPATLRRGPFPDFAPNRYRRFPR
jgi:hypothetical protein